MRKLVACLVALVATANANAGNILISGTEMNATIQGYLTTLGHTSTIVAPASLSSTSFAGYTGIWLGWNTTFSSSPALTTNLQTFLNGGGQILAETSLGNTLSFLPSQTVTQVTSHQDTVNIVAPGHPVNAGLTNAGLSGWGNSLHAYYTSYPSFTVLTDNGSGNPVTLFRNVGSGHLVLTGQDISFHIKNGFGPTGANSPKGVFVDNVFSLQAQAVPEPISMVVFA
jgi:hypothetical protein